MVNKNARYRVFTQISCWDGTGWDHEWRLEAPKPQQGQLAGSGWSYCRHPSLQPARAKGRSQLPRVPTSSAVRLLLPRLPALNLVTCYKTRLHSTTTYLALSKRKKCGRISADCWKAHTILSSFKQRLLHSKPGLLVRCWGSKGKGSQEGQKWCRYIQLYYVRSE